MAQKRNAPKTTQTRGTKGGRSNAKTPATSSVGNTIGYDITGVALAAVGLALLVAVMSKKTGIVTEGVAYALRMVLGVGCYILPVAMMLWGLSFFIPRVQVREMRVGVGLGILLVSAISLVSLMTPGAQFFDSSLVSAYGGFVGGLFAWILVKLTGTTIATILLIALFLIGLVVTGLSFSALTESIGAFISGIGESRAERVATAEPLNKTSRVTGQRKDPRTRGFSSDDEQGSPVTIVGSSTPGATAAQRTQELSELESRKTQLLGISTKPRATGPRAMEGFELPALSLLKKTPDDPALKSKGQQIEMKQTADNIVDTLGTFDIPARIVDWITGPTVTLFKVEIAKGIRLNRVTALIDDLALALAASTLRILAPIPGESLVGIEVPNAKRSSVTLGDVLTPAGEGGPLTLGIGKDVSGASVLGDLAAMPHLLIGGTTGSGKSVAINAMLMSMIMRCTPSEVRLILIDPKRVELSLYNGIPHLYVPVVTEPKEAASALAWAVLEMERRLKVLQKAKVRDIGLYNELLQSDKAPEWAEEMPYLVIVIDELADLMMVAAKEVEESIVRLAQLARAAGIHLIVATQRPEANVVTGLIKANITNRIAFNVASSIDSRVILDQPGAEKLTGLGDMLFSVPAWPKPKRVQGCYVSESEITEAVDQLKAQGEPEYHDEILHTRVVSISGTSGGGPSGDDDPLLWDAADMVVSSGFGSTSAVQRRFRVGYARAGRIMDMLEDKGIVGPPDGSKPREVFVDSEGLALMKSADSADNEVFE